METKNGQQRRLAVLIDADNASPAIIEPLLAEIAKYGVSTVKRIYGDWTSPNLGGWKKVLASFAIQPIQQFRHTIGKNATDSAMIIDAMDLLYTKRFDGFCIVSSDSDFTRLASRIREEGAIVYGFGERKTPDSFVSACDRFIYTEILKKDKGRKQSSAKKTAGGHERKSAEALKKDEKLVSILFDAIDAVADDDGWARLGSVGSKIFNQYPSFDSRNYGYAKLSSLIRTIGLFVVATRQAGTDPKNRSIHIKRKQTENSK
ncbi:MAG: NYN domain-containing protein [Candidatus Euphemobacter frigidus]|nr:NYN domain-containing protein [Candidatus Euphemobacter frigidus]